MYRSQKLPKIQARLCSFPELFLIAMEIQVISGGRTRTRTLDPLIKSQLLYQLSYAP